MGIRDDFLAFIQRGSVVDLVVGLVMGTAFIAIVNSLVDDIILPPLFFFLPRSLEDLCVPGACFIGGKTCISMYFSASEAEKDDVVVIKYGALLSAIMRFFIVSLALFFIVRAYSRAFLYKLKETRECPACFQSVKAKSIRCSFCTEDLPAEKPVVVHS